MMPLVRDEFFDDKAWLVSSPKGPKKASARYLALAAAPQKGSARCAAAIRRCSIGKLAIFLTLGFCAFLALSLGLGLGLPPSSSSSSSSLGSASPAVLSVTVGPTSTDSQGRPVINAARARCALAQAAGIPLSAVQFSVFVSSSGSLTVVSPTSPLNSATVNCASLNYSVPAARRLVGATVATNTTLTASQAGVEVTLRPTASVATVMQKLRTLGSSDGFALLAASVLSAGSGSTGTANAEGEVLVIEPSVSPSTAPTPSVSPSVSASLTPSPSASLSPTPTPTFVALPLAAPSGYKLNSPIAALGQSSSTFIVGLLKTATPFRAAALYANFSDASAAPIKVEVQASSSSVAVQTTAFTYSVFPNGPNRFFLLGVTNENAAAFDPTGLTGTESASITIPDLDCPAAAVKSVAWSPYAASLSTKGRVYFVSSGGKVGFSDELTHEYKISALTLDGTAGGISTNPATQGVYFTFNGAGSDNARQLRRLEAEVPSSGSVLNYDSVLIADLAPLLGGTSAAAEYKLRDLVSSWDGGKAFVVFVKTSTGFGGIAIVELTGANTVRMGLAINVPRYTGFTDSPLTALFKPGAITMVPLGATKRNDQVAVVDLTDGSEGVWIGIPALRTESAINTILPSLSVTSTPSATPSPSASVTSSVTSTHSATPSPSASVSASASASLSVTPAPSVTATFTPLPLTIPAGFKLNGPITALGQSSTTFVAAIKKSTSPYQSSLAYANFTSPQTAPVKIDLETESTESIFSVTSLSYPVTSGSHNFLHFGRCEHIRTFFNTEIKKVAVADESASSFDPTALVGSPPTADQIYYPRPNTCEDGIVSMAWSPYGAASATRGRGYHVVVGEDYLRAHDLQDSASPSFPAALADGFPWGVAVSPTTGNVFFTSNGDSPGNARDLRQLVSTQGNGASASTVLIADLRPLFGGTTAAAGYSLRDFVINWAGTTAFIVFVKTSTGFGGIAIVKGIDGSGTLTMALAGNPPRYTDFASPFDAQFKPGAITMVPTGATSHTDQVAVVDLTDGSEAVWIGVPIPVSAVTSNVNSVNLVVSL